MIRLLLVDDQPQIRRGLEMRLALESDVVVIGTAGNAAEALQLASSLRPDVIVVDVELPGMNGIELTRSLRQLLPDTAVVILSLHDDGETIGRACAAGACAFVGKHRMEGPLLAAIRSAAPSAHLGD